MKTVLGILGGSGLYSIDGLTNIERFEVQSDFGKPSDSLIIGDINGLRVVFLSRHGKGHFYAPHEINYRANIDVLKRVGVTDIISVSACGSLKENLTPGMFVLVDQFIDQTKSRQNSFFESGLIAHVSMARPTCNRLANVLEGIMLNQGFNFQKGGTYIAIEGPQFSTIAESKLYRSWGCDVIGMTNMPEARLAREAEICYQTVAIVTDFDCWNDDHGHVDVKMVDQILADNSNKSKILITEAAKIFSERREICVEGCDRALDFNLEIHPDADPRMKHKLKSILERSLSETGR